MLFTGAAFEGRQSVHRLALRGEDTTGDRRTQEGDGKALRLLSQARPSGPRLRQGSRGGIHRKGVRASHTLQQRVSLSYSAASARASAPHRHEVRAHRDAQPTPTNTTGCLSGSAVACTR
jgi:hypothetical protein